MVCPLVKLSVVVVSVLDWLIVVMRTTAPLLYQVMVCPLRYLLLEHTMLTELPAVTTPPPAADRMATGLHGQHYTFIGKEGDIYDTQEVELPFELH